MSKLYFIKIDNESEFNKIIIYIRRNKIKYSQILKGSYFVLHDKAQAKIVGEKYEKELMVLRRKR